MSVGFQWSAWAFAQISAADFDAEAIADAGSATSDEISVDGKAACEIAVTSVEDNTGATDGDVTVSVLRYGATGWQVADDAAVVQRVAQEQNTTHHLAANVDPGDTGSFKVHVANDCGQGVAVSVKYRTATFDDGT